jgi:hypothetical protein
MLNTLQMLVTLCVTLRPREPIFLRSTRRCFATADGLKQLRPDPKVSLVLDPNSPVLNFVTAQSTHYSKRTDSGNLSSHPPQFTNLLTRTLLTRPSIKNVDHTLDPP